MDFCVYYTQAHPRTKAWYQAPYTHFYYTSPKSSESFHLLTGVGKAATFPTKEEAQAVAQAQSLLWGGGIPCKTKTFKVCTREELEGVYAKYVQGVPSWYQRKYGKPCPSDVLAQLTKK